MPLSQHRFSIQATILTALLGVFGIFTILFILLVPFAEDQGIFAWQAMELLNGGLPYVASWDVKGPTSTFLYAGMFLVFGHSPIAVHLLDIILMLIALYRCGIFFYKKYSLERALFFIVMLLSLGWADIWIVSQPDLWCAWIILIFLPTLITPKSPTYEWMLLAFAVALMVWFKPTYGLLIFILMIQAYKKGVGKIFFTTLMLSLIPFPLLYLLTNHWNALWETLVLFNLNHHRTNTSHLLGILGLSPVSWTRPTSENIIWWLAGTLRNIFIIAAPLLLVSRYCQKDTNYASLMFQLYLALTINIQIQGHYFFYHLLPLIFLSFFICINMKWERKYLNISAGFLFVIIYSLDSIPSINHLRLLSSYPFSTNPLIFYRDYSAAAHYGMLGDIINISSKIQEITRPDDKIALYGFSASILYYSQRLSVSRFGYNYPLFNNSHSGAEAYRNEYMETIKLQKSPLIIVQRNDINPLSDKPSVERLEDFVDLKQYITQYYHLVHENDSFQIYGR